VIQLVALEHDKQLSGHPSMHVFDYLFNHRPFTQDVHTLGYVLLLQVRQLSSQDLHFFSLKK